MSIPRESKEFPGTQTDTYSYDRNAKPYQSPCDRPDQHQFQDFPNQDINSTGYGNQYGINEIPYGQGAAFERSTVITVDTSRADRGSDS